MEKPKSKRPRSRYIPGHFYKYPNGALYFAMPNGALRRATLEEEARMRAAGKM